jgi:GntR family transcriptional regulator, transcriptional repressor for pyruvate dehydrogenase complex
VLNARHRYAADSHQPLRGDASGTQDYPPRAPSPPYSPHYLELLAAERIPPHELRELREVVALNRGSAETHHRQQFRESDAAFHRVIAEATHNPFLAATIATTTRAQGWVFDIAAGRTQELLLSYVEQHAAILGTIQEGEPDAAAQAMQVHLEWALAHSKQEVRRRLGVEAVE